MSKVTSDTQHPLQKHGLSDNHTMRCNDCMPQQTVSTLHRVRTVMMRQRQMRRPWRLQKAGSQTPLMQIPAAAPAVGACMISSACLWGSMAARSCSSPSTGASQPLHTHHKMMSCYSAKASKQVQWVGSKWVCPKRYANISCFMPDVLSGCTHVV